MLKTLLLSTLLFACLLAGCSGPSGINGTYVSQDPSAPGKTLKLNEDGSFAISDGGSAYGVYALMEDSVILKYKPSTDTTAQTQTALRLHIMDNGNLLTNALPGVQPVGGKIEYRRH